MSLAARTPGGSDAAGSGWRWGRLLPWWPPKAGRRYSPSFFNHGGMSEWLKETGCKPVGSAYAGSNPAPPTAVTTELIFQS